jgi:NAD(P)-dependent dehydrogenase (short-subunit alcohol dehydrogenase family)
MNAQHQRLLGKVAIITGAGQGILQVIAKAWRDSWEH